MQRQIFMPTVHGGASQIAGAAIRKLLEKKRFSLKFTRVHAAAMRGIASRTDFEAKLQPKPLGNHHARTSKPGMPAALLDANELASTPSCRSICT